VDVIVDRTRRRARSTERTSRSSGRAHVPRSGETVRVGTGCAVELLARSAGASRTISVDDWAPSRYGTDRRNAAIEALEQSLILASTPVLDGTPHALCTVACAIRGPPARGWSRPPRTGGRLGFTGGNGGVEIVTEGRNEPRDRRAVVPLSDTVRPHTVALCSERLGLKSRVERRGSR